MRLKRVLNSLILENQYAFVPGRQMLDGVLVANEIVDYAPRTKKESLLFKVDFDKAFDRVSWDFLRYMMKRMGFRSIWLKWMEAIVFTSHFFVLINKSPSKDFEVEIGLR